MKTRHGLTLKLISLILMIIMLSSLIQIYVVINKEVKINKENLLETSSSFATLSSRSIAENYKLYYDSGFYKFSENIEEIMNKDNNLEKFLILNYNGNILFDSKELQVGKYSGPQRNFDNLSKLEDAKRLKTTSSEVTINGQNYIEIIFPHVEEWGKREHIMVYYFSLQELEQSTKRIVLNTLLWMVPLTILSLIVILLFSRNILIKPLHKLSTGFNLFKEGKPDYEVKLKSLDEIQEIADNFNDMAKELIKSKKELEIYSRGLEEKVTERTRELETKNNDLKKFNNLAIDRELKMIELKERIKELEEKLKQQK